MARGGNRDNRDYNDEELDNLDYYGGRSEGQVFLAENGDGSAPSELETEAINGRNTDSDVEAYLGNRREAGEYRDAVRTIGRDAFKTFAETNLARRGKGKSEQPSRKFAEALWKYNGLLEIWKADESKQTNVETMGGDVRKWQPTSG